MLQKIMRLLGRDHQSKAAACERLRLVLVHDRAFTSPEVINTIKDELIKVIEKYMVVDEPGIQVDIERDAESVALVASIPIMGMRRAAGG
ncbi:MAG: cell division topological specificity factor MinE [Syntrophomonadaceae bacterium]|nr:cell division topological specificity factor MinE [Syntrophomonadaceae bacterium]